MSLIQAQGTRAGCEGHLYQSPGIEIMPRDNHGISVACGSEPWAAGDSFAPGPSRLPGTSRLHVPRSLPEEAQRATETCQAF